MCYRKNKNKKKIVLQEKNGDMVYWINLVDFFVFKRINENLDQVSLDEILFLIFLKQRIWMY